MYLTSALKGLKRFFVLSPYRSDTPEHRSFVVFNYGFLFALLIHTSFILLFSVLRIPFLFYFNIGSVLIYLLLICMNRLKLIITCCTIAGIEILTHQSLVVIYLGWDTNIWMYIYLAFLSMFFLPAGKIFFKSAVIVTCLATLTSLFYYSRTHTPLVYAGDSIINSIGLFSILTTSLCIFLYAHYYRSLADKSEMLLAEEHKRSESLLLNILPPKIAGILKKDPDSIAHHFDSVTVIFADIVNFTQFAHSVAPYDLVEKLNIVFTRFDEIVETYGLEKIKTIGDAYMAVAGIPEPLDDHALRAIQASVKMISAMDELKKSNSLPFTIRIGISSGPVVAGVIGKKKFIYDLWGDDVNKASRMESHGIPGQIQVTESTYKLLKDRYSFEKRSDVQIKGIGTIDTYIYSHSA